MRRSGGILVRLLDFPDEAGRFELTDAPVGRELELTLTPPVGPEQSLRVSALAPGEQRTLQFVLDAGATLSGVARDEHGAPLEGVTVELDDLRPSHLASVESDEMDRARRVQTDAEGTFRFGSLPRCAWILRLKGPRAPAPLELDTRAGDLSGIVLARESGQELLVEAVWADGFPAQMRLTVEPPVRFIEVRGPGLYALTGIEGFPLQVSARAWRDGRRVTSSATATSADAPLRLVLDWAPAERTSSPIEFPAVWIPPEGWNLDAEPDPAFEKRIAMECELAGRVEDDRGRPRNDVSLRLRGVPASGKKTDVRGEFFYSELAAGQEVLVVEDPRTGVRLQRSLELTPERRACVELRLPTTSPVLVRGRLQFGSEPPLTPIRLDGELGFAKLTLTTDGAFEAEFPFAGRYSGLVRFGQDLAARRLVIDAPGSDGLTIVIDELPVAD